MGLLDSNLQGLLENKFGTRLERATETMAHLDDSIKDLIREFKLLSKKLDQADD